MKGEQTVKKKLKKKKVENRERESGKKKNGPDIHKFGYDTTPINPKLAGDQ